MKEYVHIGDLAGAGLVSMNIARRLPCFKHLLLLGDEYKGGFINGVRKNLLKMNVHSGDCLYDGDMELFSFEVKKTKHDSSIVLVDFISNEQRWCKSRNVDCVHVITRSFEQNPPCDIVLREMPLKDRFSELHLYVTTNCASETAIRNASGLLHSERDAIFSYHFNPKDYAHPIGSDCIDGDISICRQCNNSYSVNMGGSSVSEKYLCFGTRLHKHGGACCYYLRHGDEMRTHVCDICPYYAEHFVSGVAQ